MGSSTGRRERIEDWDLASEARDPKDLGDDLGVMFSTVPFLVVILYTYLRPRKTN